MSLLPKIDKNHLPEHIAIIMDGNGRWAKNLGMDRIFGHHSGVDSVKDIVEGGVEAGIKYLTLYTFSTENWNRPQSEVDALMALLVTTIAKERDSLIKNKICLNTIGDLSALPKECIQELEETRAATAKNSKMTLTLALSYSSRWEIIQAVKRIAAAHKDGELSLDDINESTFASNLTTRDIPDPALMIRTSGECRISNYLLWQMAYTELYFTDVNWPDFRRENLFQAIIDFQSRERRFGKTSAQVKQ